MRQLVKWAFWFSILGMSGCGYEATGGGEEGVETIKQSLTTWDPVTTLPGTTTTLSSHNWDRKEAFAIVDNQPKNFAYLAPYPATVSAVPGGAVGASGAKIGAAKRLVLHPINNNLYYELEVFTRKTGTKSQYVIMQQENPPTELTGYFWNASWSAPFGIFNPILGSPAVSSTGSLEGDLDVYVVGTDNQLYINSYVHTGAVTDPYSVPGQPDAWGHVNGSWTGYSPLGGVVSAGTSPAAASNRFGVVTRPERDVFVRNTSGTLSWRYWKSGFGWSGWVDPAPGFTFVGSPVATRSGIYPNDIDVFVLGTDGNIWRNRLTITNLDANAPRAYTWTGYQLCGKPTGTTLAAENIAASGYDVLVRATNGTVYRAAGDCP